MKIGFIGLAGAGKDTAAEIMQELLTQYGEVFKIDRFAHPLKRAAKRIFGDQFDNRDVKEVPVFVNQDVLIEASFDALRSCGLTDDEMDKASELFFEHIGFLEYLSPRKYQQLLGTEVGRAVRSTVWSDRIYKQKASILVPDVRFAGEMCDYNILITRHPVQVVGKVHSSELLATEMQLGLDESYDALIVNKGTLDDLRTKLDRLVSQLIQTGVIK